MTAIFVVSGLAIPAVLAHVRIIQLGALFMSIAGGIVVYGTILVRNEGSMKIIPTVDFLLFFIVWLCTAFGYRGDIMFLTTSIC